MPPNNPPNVEFISAVELACQRLLVQDVQELRTEVNYLLKRAKPPRSNITKEEKGALKELRADQDRMELTEDKGEDMVVMDRKEYVDNVEGLLEQPVYKTTSSNPKKQAKGQVNTEAKKNQK